MTIPSQPVASNPFGVAPPKSVPLNQMQNNPPTTGGFSTQPVGATMLPAPMLPPQGGMGMGAPPPAMGAPAPMMGAPPPSMYGQMPVAMGGMPPQQPMMGAGAYPMATGGGGGGTNPFL